MFIHVSKRSIHTLKFNSSPPEGRYRDPIGKEPGEACRLPSIIFQGRAVKLRRGISNVRLVVKRDFCVGWTKFGQIGRMVPWVFSYSPEN